MMEEAGAVIENPCSDSNSGDFSHRIDWGGEKALDNEECTGREKKEAEDVVDANVNVPALASWRNTFRGIKGGGKKPDDKTESIVKEKKEANGVAGVNVNVRALTSWRLVDKGGGEKPDDQNRESTAKNKKEAEEVVYANVNVRAVALWRLAQKSEKHSFEDSALKQTAAQHAMMVERRAIATEQRGNAVDVDVNTHYTSHVDYGIPGDSTGKKATSAAITKAVAVTEQGIARSKQRRDAVDITTHHISSFDLHGHGDGIRRGGEATTYNDKSEMMRNAAKQVTVAEQWATAAEQRGDNVDGTAHYTSAFNLHGDGDGRQGDGSRKVTFSTAIDKEKESATEKAAQRVTIAEQWAARAELRGAIDVDGNAHNTSHFDLFGDGQLGDCAGEKSTPSMKRKRA
jgi:hypothetical protein